MLEKRRHQRVRFDDPLPMNVGHRGERATCGLENLSLGGLMFRSTLQLTVGETIGCEFSVFESPLIDIVATVTSRVGNGLYGARFEAGPMSQHLVEDAINNAIYRGKATVLSIHDLAEGKIMRIAGGLSAATRNDFLHGVARVGVIDIDLSEVTAIDEEGVSLVALAATQYKLPLSRRSPCIDAIWHRVSAA